MISVVFMMEFSGVCLLSLMREDMGNGQEVWETYQIKCVGILWGEIKRMFSNGVRRRVRQS
jgi:hypothetical protein